MKSWLKILLIALILIIVVAGVGAVKLFGPRAFLGPRARPLTNRTFERTPARLQRGAYLVTGMLACVDCHSPHDWSKHDAPVPPGKMLSGSVLPEAGLPGIVVAPNLTSDPETGAGNWTDDMLARAIREGIGHDGRGLFSMMPYGLYRGLPDEDLASVVVYLRSLPPVRNPLPKTQIIFPVKYIMLNEPQPITTPVLEPATSTAVDRGRYLVGLVGCGECHTPVDNHHNFLPHMDFAGGQIFDGPWGKVASANLTTDASGIPYYDEAMFIKTMRTGSVGARELNQVMPWWAFGHMTDQDLSAIFAYLKSVKPAVHRVDNSLPATLCPIDGEMHGGGNQNRKE
jgi:mono/diheme cytochrome c family protein